MIRSKHIWLSGLAVLVCGAFGDPALSATPDPERLTRTVRYGDLDLSSPAGAKALYRRIQTAARGVCPARGRGVVSIERWAACYEKAVSDAVASVNHEALTALHRGTPTRAIGS
ncbi:MAG: UrcA family protein [Steroidobacteraceae bacterium]